MEGLVRSSGGEERTGPQRLAIVGATVIAGDGSAPRPGATILIEDGRITAVDTSGAALPPGFDTLDATGRYLIPGLMDANVHLVIDAFPVTLLRYEGRYHELAIEAAQVALKNGITSVFDSWGPVAALVKARDLIESGAAEGARIRLAGNIVGFGGPCSEDFYPHLSHALFDYADAINDQWQQQVGPELVSMAPDQVRAAIRGHIASGIDFLKYAVTVHDPTKTPYITFSPRVQHVIVEEARAAGLSVQTHTTSIEGIHLAIDAGVDMLQHIEVTGPVQSTPPETVAHIVQQQVAGAMLAETDAVLEWSRIKAETEPALKFALVSDRNQRALIAAGANILLSTDGGVFSADTRESKLWKRLVPPEDCRLALGEGHFHWLRAVEQKGMRPMEALMAATSRIAKAYGVDADLGTIAPGKIADLVLLDSDPLADAAHYRRIAAVLKAGRIIDREAPPRRPLLTA